MSTAFAELDVAQWRELTRTGQPIAGLVDQAGAAVEQSRELNVYITETLDRAKAQAKASDERIRAGKPRALEGLPVAIKDCFCTAGIQTTCGSKILKGFVPQYESFVSQRLLDAGAVVLGKTNMDEFGMGSSTENSAYGPTINPRGLKLGSRDYVPGGSSGGASAAVAGNFALAALAEDTGGSIRQPASFCGVVGFKPTYGVCSRWGVVPYASSLDQAGVIAKTVHDTAILMDVIAGEDGRDSTSVQCDFGGFETGLKDHDGAFVVGLPRQMREISGSSDLEGLWREIENRVAAAGGTTKMVDLPTIASALPAYYIIALAEASSNLARYDGVRYGHRTAEASNLIEMYEKTRGEGFGAEVRRRIIMGTYCLSSGYYDAYYARAQKVRAKICQEYDAAFKEVDFLAWPTAPTPAFKFGCHTGDAVSMYLEDVFTVPVNLGGLPAISLPIFDAQNGMPMGGQLIGQRFTDTKLLAAANGLMGA